MRNLLRLSARLLLLCVVLVPAAARAVERPYREGRSGAGELKYINDLPVLMVAGTPAEMGEQKAALTGDVVRKLVDYPKALLRMGNRESDLPKFQEMARSLAPQIPADYRNELRAFGAKAGLDREVGVLGNVMIDIYRHGFACSSLIVEADHSATKGPLFGRNLDFYTLGLLEPYSLVTVQRPKGKHAFASVGFPGLFGCVSGLNDAGLAVAVHEVFFSRDGSPLFNPKGVPYAFCFRRILEECSTVAEAEKLLRGTERTTLLSLAVCDRNGGAVFELTPKTVAVRHGQQGICACTNHFRTPDLKMLALCHRYSILIRARSSEQLDLADVAQKLHQVNLGRLTVQTMIFEPAALNLHLAIGERPSSALPLKKLELTPLFAPGKE